MKLLPIIIVYGCFILTGDVLAQNSSSAPGPSIAVTPSVIDEEARAGEVFNYTVRLKNNSDRLAEIYTFVNDLDAEGGLVRYNSPSELDRVLSLARWVEIKRALTKLQPGEEVELPLKIDVDSKATPGKRHALIAFLPGNNRYTAEEGLTQGQGARLFLNFNITEEIIDKAQVSGFRLEKDIVVQGPAVFLVTVVNSGNRPIAPQGKIYIYDRRNVEVAALTVDFSADPVAPGESSEKRLEWKEAKGIGKFKARLELDYGQATRHELNDTAFFWLLPLPFVLAFGAGVFLLFILMMTILLRRTRHADHLIASSELVSSTPARPAAPAKDKKGVIDLRK